MGFNQHVYRRRSFAVYRLDYGFIVYNHAKPYRSGHTHIQSYHKAKQLIDVVLNKRIPTDYSKYLLISLIRIAEDAEYIQKLNDRLAKKQKEASYAKTSQKRK